MTADDRWEVHFTDLLELLLELEDDQILEFL
jgi:hypothetical protein